METILESFEAILFVAYLLAWFLFYPVYDRTIMRPATRAGVLPGSVRRDALFAGLVQLTLVVAVVGLRLAYRAPFVPANFAGWLWVSLPAAVLLFTILHNSVAVLSWTRLSMRHSLNHVNPIHAIATVPLAVVAGGLAAKQVVAASTMSYFPTEEVHLWFWLLCLWPLSAWQLLTVTSQVTRALGADPLTPSATRLRAAYGYLALIIWIEIPLLPTF